MKALTLENALDSLQIKVARQLSELQSETDENKNKILYFTEKEYIKEKLINKLKKLQISLYIFAFLNFVLIK